MKELYISFITLIACLVTLSSATFAYFTKDRTLAVASVQTANYELTIASDDEKTGVCDYKRPYSYTCQTAKDDIHVFTMVPVGESASEGYCVINIGDNTYSTASISERFTLKIRAKKGTEITFSANWGEYMGDQPVCENERILEISTTAYQEYTVEKDVTWEMIAQYYSVSVEELKIFNGITEIHEGDKIKIPGTTVTDPYALKKVSQEEEQTQNPLVNMTDPETDVENTETPEKPSEGQPGNTEIPEKPSEDQTENTETPEKPSEGQPGNTETPENSSESQPGNTEIPENSSEGQPGNTETQENSSEGQPGNTETPENPSEGQPENTETPEILSEEQEEKIQEI